MGDTKVIYPLARRRSCTHVQVELRLLLSEPLKYQPIGVWELDIIPDSLAQICRPRLGPRPLAGHDDDGFGPLTHSKRIQVWIREVLQRVGKSIDGSISDSIPFLQVQSCQAAQAHCVKPRSIRMR